MIQDINKYVDFLIEYNITQEQFLLCYLLYTDAIKELPDGRRKYPDVSNSSSAPIARMYKYIDYIHKRENKNAWTHKDIEHLEKVGFISRPDNVSSTSPDLLKLEDEFIDSLFATDSDFEIFWDTYPGFIDNFNNPNGRKIKLKAVDKDQLEKEFKSIVITNEDFKFLMDNLKWAIKTNNINMNIRNYLTSRQWKEDNKLRTEQQDTLMTGYGLDEA